MPRWELEIQVFPTFRRRVTNRWLRTVVEHTLEGEAGEQFGVIGLTIADDETLHRLNREYGGVDEVTDVLAFSSDAQGGAPGGARLEGRGSGTDRFVTPAEVPSILGDVVVSYPQAARQARQQRYPVRREVALLVAHGILHLLGYDHAEPDQQREMWTRQDRVVAQVLRADNS